MCHQVLVLKLCDHTKFCARKKHFPCDGLVQAGFTGDLLNGGPPQTQYWSNVFLVDKRQLIYTTQQQSKNLISDSSRQHLRSVVIYKRHFKPLINPPFDIGDKFSPIESPTIKIGEFKMKAVVSEVQ